MKVIDNSVILKMFKLTVDDKQRRAFNEVGKRNMVTSVTIENGTLAMYHTENEQGQNVMLEVYDGAKAYDQHRQSPQFNDFLKVAEDAVQDQQKFELIPQFLGEQEVSLNVTTDNQMRVNIVHLTVKAGCDAKLKKLLTDYLTQAMQAETEILVCYVAQKQDQPNQWLTFQVFQNEETFKNYVNSAGFKEVQKQMAPLLDGRQLEQLDGRVLMNKGHY
ncbi:putative quinol monooxygenase [uncultured Limosilactobacillus sp.]|uniref:putative quinol monooxygenase n=1 Tax=uncultured Limosilactobacillus sp. TaxID=2837629 RepID=UPI0025CBCCC2|nr:antibiotic biosynthesis monooxygenase [uncultured Limosilactobacillus sp.]